MNQLLFLGNNYSFHGKWIWITRDQSLWEHLQMNDLFDPSPKCEASFQKPLSMLETLSLKRQGLQAQINDVEAAITALEAHPEIVNLLDLIRRVQRY